MKRPGVSFLLLVKFIIFSNTLKANPIGARFFSELVFDSTGWRLEMNLTMPTEQKDSLSLKGWYLVCGFDASMLPSGVCLYPIQAGEFRSAKKMTVMK